MQSKDNLRLFLSVIAVSALTSAIVLMIGALLLIPWLEARLGPPLPQNPPDSPDYTPFPATPTGVLDFWPWGLPLVFNEVFGGVPAGTRAVIRGLFWEGNERWLSVETEERKTLDVPERVLAPPPGTPFPDLPMATPRAIFDYCCWDWNRPLLLVEEVEGVPAGTEVRITGSYFDWGETWYNVITENERMLAVRESQLELPPGAPMPSGPLVTPTSRFDRWNWGQPLYTMEEVSNIPAGTRVRITTMWWDGEFRWVSVVTDDGTVFDIREDLLSTVPLDATGE